MNAENVSVIYDRKHTVETKGFAKLEIRVYLGNGVRKYVTVGEATPRIWEKLATSVSVLNQVKKFQKILSAMDVMDEKMTKENFERHIEEMDAQHTPEIHAENEYVDRTLKVHSVISVLIILNYSAKLSASCSKTWYK